MRTLLLLAFLTSTFFISTKAFSQCATGETYTVGPPGPWANGQVVTICYTVGSYTQTSSNWLHSFIFSTIGSAWDPASIVITQMPQNQSGVGTWGFYNSVTSSASGQAYGPGVFYDSGGDNNPGNNYGDNCGGCSWTICFEITVQDATGVFDLFFATASDGTTGSWTGGSGDCGDDFTGINLISIPPCNQPVITPTIVAPICAASNGSVSLSVAGVAPYIYAWDNLETTQSIINLAEGTYNVTVTDATGCNAVGSYNLVADFSSGPTVTGVATNPTCQDGDGNIALSVNGGTPAYAYSWSNGETNATASNLIEGFYDVIVKDANACTAYYSANLTIQDSVVLGILQSADPLCHDECTGTATTSITAGGTQPFAYTWSNNEFSSNAVQLCSGFSAVTITDSHGCVDSASVTLNNPPALELTFTTVPTSCYGYADGEAVAYVQYGTAPYAFTWAPTGAINDTITNIPAGLYYVLATDINSCTAYSSVTVNQPLPMLLDFQTHDARCYGDSSGYIEFAAAQGTGPYLFAWSNGDTLPDNVDLLGLPIGTYSVVVTDASGCTTDSSVVINQPTPVVISFQSYPASCEVAHDGYDTAFATGGVPGYNYVWNTEPQTIGPAADNLAVGTYTVSVTDANNCLYIDSSYVVALPLFGVTASADMELIRGFQTFVSVETDTFGNFGYEWTPYVGIDNPYSWTTLVMPDSTVTYTVMVTDIETGCQAMDSVVITVTPNPFLYVPNAFSPNGDDMNDMFFPIPGDGVTVKSFSVFNRWGERIYGGDWFPGWDGRYNGKPCPLAVYTYYCDYTKPDGTPSRKQGTVLLMR